MAGVPTNFQTISNVLPTYNFADIVSGTGYINFYAGDTVDTYALSNFTYYSNDIFIPSGTFNDAAYGKRLDLDFDVLVNKPLVVKGKGIVNVGLGINFPGTTQCYLTLRVRKWDGVTETEIATNDSSVRTGAGSPRIYTMTATDIDIPLTLFKIGQTLRLTVELWGKTTAGNNGDVNIGIDPMNRTTGWDTTGAVPSKLLFQCPTRLNL